MDKQKQNGSAANEKRANILLTLCIVLIGIMLFLMTDKGAAMLASLGISNTNADYYEYTVIGENEKVDPEIYADIDPEATVKAISADWPSSEWWNAYSDAGKQEYRIASEWLNIDITFISTGGVFSSITVQYAAQSEPSEPKGELSPIEQYMFAKERETYDAHCQEVRIMLNALLCAINGGTDGIDTALNMLHSAAISAEESGKVNSFSEMHMDFRIYTTGSKAEKAIVISIEQNNQTK